MIAMCRVELRSTEPRDSARRSRALPARFQFSQQESLLRHRRWQLQRARKLLGGTRAIAASQPKLAERRVKERVLAKRGARGDRLDRIDSGPRTLRHRDGYRSIERRNRRRVHLQQLVVERDDVTPIRFFERWRRRMTRGDGCLNVIGRDFVARRRSFQMPHPPCNELPIPARAVLLLENSEIA